ncbi:type VI secretion system tip protein TssI/VgrG, partial [Pseudomonas mangrovi]
RIEAIQTQFERVQLRGKVRGVGAGHLFKLTNYPREDQNREYLVISASYQIAQESAESGRGGGDQFNSSLVCIEATQPYRLLPMTVRPIVQGPQTAMVVGPQGEEIWTDQYGRVKVHFYWDRHDQSNENSSCWIRVSQYWAGKNWGAIHVPRIGQEVIVSFLEGDPDRPIITGRVYNAEQTVPYELPANATQSGIKSRSSKGGTPANFNEIRMEDKKGAEQLYIHAERNQDIVVENDESHFVGHNRNRTVGNDETVRIVRDRLRGVKRNDSLLVGGARRDAISTQYLIEAGAQIRLVCGKSVLEFNASGEINISGTAFNIFASGNGNIDTGGRLDLNSGGASEVPAQGQGDKGSIDAEVEALFPPPKEQG